jgi:hypothetical protein
MARAHQTVLAVALVATALGIASCGKKDLDAQVDRLVAAAQRNDYPGFQTLAHPSLVQAFPSTKLELVSRALAKLGTYRGRSMTGIKASTGDVRSGTYDLRFEQGNVTLELTITQGRLTAFHFSGDSLKRAMRAISDEEYRTFKVNSFQFVDANKAPRSNVFQVGQPAHFRLEVQGLTRTPSGLKLNVQLRVLGEGGRVVLEKPDFISTTLVLKPDDPPVATVNGELTLDGPGVFKLELRAVDVPSGRHVDHQQVLSVEKP